MTTDFWWGHPYRRTIEQKKLLNRLIGMAPSYANLIGLLLSLLVIPVWLTPARAVSRDMEDRPLQVDIGTYAEDTNALLNVVRLTESVRTFGGRLANTPIWLYVPDAVAVEVLSDTTTTQKLEASGVVIRTVKAPVEVGRFFYGYKPFAAAEAESLAAGEKVILIWMDDDTVVLSEPLQLLLDSAHVFAYRPVMHNRSGSLYDQPPSPYWSRILELLSVSDNLLFPMISVADRQKIRTYFNCGLIAVRPERGILARWAEDFLKLSRDSQLVEMCRQDATKGIFLHQTALVGAVLHNASRNELVELNDRYNYPAFFHKQFAAEKPFDDLTNVVTVRTEVLLKNAGPDWATELKGPATILEWLRTHLAEK